MCSNCFSIFAVALVSATATPSKSPTRTAVERADGWLGKDADYALICPSASNTERNWLTDRYAALARHCHARGLEVVLTAAQQSGKSRLLRISKQAAIPHNLAEQANLKELLALCRARDRSGPDSGTLHMATTQGTPVVGLYAHSNPRRTAIAVCTCCRRLHPPLFSMHRLTNNRLDGDIDEKVVAHGTHWRRRDH